MNIHPSEDGIIGLEPVSLSTLSRNTMRFSSSIIDSIDSTIDVPVEKDELVEKALAQYDNSVKLCKSSRFSPERDAFCEAYQLPVLDPVRVDLVLQCLLPIAAKDEGYAGLLVSDLIKASYAAGNNGFVLHTQDVPVDFLCAGIKGIRGKPVNITVYGNTGNYTGRESEWCSMRHEGNAQDHYFDDAEHAEIFISGTFTEYPLIGAADTTLRTTDRKMFNYVIHKMVECVHYQRGRHVHLVDDVGNTLDAFNDSYLRKRGGP